MTFWDFMVLAYLEHDSLVEYLMLKQKLLILKLKAKTVNFKIITKTGNFKFEKRKPLI